MPATLSHLPGTVHAASDTHHTYDAVAAAMEAEAIHAVQHRGVFHLALSGGSTPEQLYINLVADPRYRAFPWRDTHLWQVDERRVPHDDERSNFKMLRETLTVHADIPEAQVHAMPVLEDDPVAAYEAELARVFGIDAGGPPPRLDFVLLGMGGDLHTASLFPHSKALGVTDRWIAINEGPEVTPPDRVTMTYLLLNAARRLAVLLTGEKKAGPLQQLDAAFAQGSPDTQAMPVAGIAPVHEDARLDWHLDPAAAGA
ncbi:MAG: 6-phosphogluconolactonase [Phycisphaeraceae bacterium]